MKSIPVAGDTSRRYLNCLIRICHWHMAGTFLFEDLGTSAVDPWPNPGLEVDYELLNQCRIGAHTTKDVYRYVSLYKNMYGFLFERDILVCIHW